MIKYDPGCSSRIQIFYPSQIPDPGVKKAPDPGSGFAILSRPTEKEGENLPLLLLFSLYRVLPSRRYRYLMPEKNLCDNLSFKEQTDKANMHILGFSQSTPKNQCLLGMEPKIVLLFFFLRRAIMFFYLFFCFASLF
jgi:hypothetical protein